jgi:hypothetical protein
MAVAELRASDKGWYASALPRAALPLAGMVSARRDYPGELRRSRRLPPQATRRTAAPGRGRASLGATAATGTRRAAGPRFRLRVPAAIGERTGGAVTRLANEPPLVAGSGLAAASGFDPAVFRRRSDAANDHPWRRGRGSRTDHEGPRRCRERR